MHHLASLIVSFFKNNIYLLFYICGSQRIKISFTGLTSKNHQRQYLMQPLVERLISWLLSTSRSCDSHWLLNGLLCFLSPSSLCCMIAKSVQCLRIFIWFDLSLLKNPSKCNHYYLKATGEIRKEELNLNKLELFFFLCFVIILLLKFRSSKKWCLKG